MKRFRLLLAAFVAMIGLSAQAQSWTASEVGAGSYVIYNVGKGQFLTAGNAYGTQASVTVAGVGGATHVELIANSTNYFIRTGVGNTNYGLENLAAAGDVYMDQSRNKQSTWTFTQVSTDNGPVYNIVSADNHGGGSGAYLTANEGNTIVSDNGTASSPYAQWKLLPEAQIPLVAAVEEYTAVRSSVLGFKNNTSAYTDETGAAATLQSAIDTQDDAVAAATTVEEINTAKAVLSAAGNMFLSSIIITSGFDITNVWITNPAPGISGSLNGWTNSGTPSRQADLYEYWNVSAGTTKQTLKDLPKGAYALTAIAYTRDNMTATLYAGENTIKLVGCGSVNNRTEGSNWIAAGNGVNTLNFTLDATTESLEIGLIADNATGDHWMCWRSFSLTYYGDPINLAKVELAEAVAAARAYEGKIPNVAYSPISAAIADNDKTYDTVEGYNTAAAAINTAVAQNVTVALVASYARYQTVRVNALAIAPNTDAVAADEAVNAATTSDAIVAAIVMLRAAFMAELPNVTIADGSYLDVTNVLVDNPSVSVNTDYWTSELNGSDKTGGSWAVVNYGETEFYNNNFKFYQTLALIPGTWEFGVTGFHRAGNHSTYFYAGEDKILIPGVESSVVNTMAQAKTYFDNGNGKVALKFLIETAGDVEIGIDNKDTQTDKWTIFRDFTLKYYGAPDYTVYKDQWSQAVTDAEDALTAYADYDSFTATEKSALEGAKANAPAVDEKKAGYVTKINALTDATAAYIALSKKYESAKTAIASANAIKEAHNFASAEAIATFENAIKSISDKYDDATLTPEEAAAAGATLGTDVTGHRAGANSPAVNYLEDGFGLNDFDADLYLNTWSIEGASDGSDFIIPFYEYWTEDANSLGEQTWSGTLTGLENGLYEVSAWVRVRAKNEVTAGNATGITMDVNGGGEGDYAAVDVTEGAQIGESQFQIETYTAKGLVTDGNLTLNFNIAAENNISWLSFKNVKYERIGDLPVEPTTYAVNIAATENGTVEADKATATEGETVSVTVTPAEGFMVDQAYWTANEENHEIEEPEEGNHATFTMPAADVTITVTFKEIEDEPIVVPTIDATLVHTASSYCEGDANVYISKVDAEAEHVNNSKFSSTWQGAAYAEFSFETLPANAEITEAILTFTGIGESRNARNTDVMIVNVGSTLDYTAMEAGDAKVNLPATTIQSVSFPKASSQEFNIDATEQLKALVAEGQKFAIFKFTNNPGSGDVAGKASENAPKLVITYAPGAPEVANASFEADGEKAASNGALEMTGWTEVIDGSYNNTELRPAGSTSTTSQFGTSDPSEGDYSLFVRHGWNNGSTTVTLTSDALAEIPAGDYTLSVDYKQHYSWDNQQNENTKVTIALVNGEEILGSETSPAAAGVQGGSADATYFNDAEWSTLTASFTLDEPVAAGAKVVITLAPRGQRRSDFFLDNVQFVRVPGVEAAKLELQKAIEVAQAEVAKYTVGEDLFMYPESEIAPLTAAIATATDAYNDPEATKGSVNAATETLNAFVAAFAPALNAPDAEQAYSILSKQADLYMTLAEEGISIAETPCALKFEATEGGKYYITDGTYYVGLVGTDNWSMTSDAAKKEALTVSVKVVEGVTYYSFAESKGLVGVDYPKKDNKGCWANKAAGDGDAVLWTIAEFEPIPVGIKGLAADDKKASIYDLSGRKVEKMVKGGIYIVNGKKVSFK